TPTTVQFAVNWPAWAGENKVEIYDENNKVVFSICDPTSCFVQASTTYIDTVSTTLTPGYYTYQGFDNGGGSGLGDGWDNAGFVDVIINGMVVETVTVPVGASSGIIPITIPSSASWQFANSTLYWYSDVALTDTIGMGYQIWSTDLPGNQKHYVQQVSSEGCYSGIDSMAVNVIGKPAT